MRHGYITGMSLCLIATMLVCGCNKEDKESSKKKGKPGYAALAFANTTTARTTFTPSIFKVKILSAIISPDEQGATSGAASLIWSNPDCETSTQSDTQDGKEFVYDYQTDCDDADVSTFIDLAQGTTAVNEELNSQAWRVLPGTYNYVQLNLCVGGPGAPNIKFQADSMTEEYAATGGTCGVSSVAPTEPLVIGEGDSATISLSYDLADSIYTGDPAAASTDLCFNDGTISRCISGLPALNPSFATE